jgi:hypothetical protein
MAAPVTQNDPRSDRFYCFLDDQPYYLIPRRLRLSPDDSADLIVNPNCWFSWEGGIPPDKASQLDSLEGFYDPVRIAWVDDPGTGALWPFWAGGEYLSILTQLRPGEPLKLDLPPQIRRVLAESRILIDRKFLSRRRKEWQDKFVSASSQFRIGYVPVTNLLHPFHIGALRRYYRYHTRTGSYPLGDPQVSRRYASYNEPVTRFFHRQLTNAVSGLVGVRLKPSYVYWASYQSGSELPKHTDREQCEYSITLCIDASPEPHGETPWSIRLDSADGPVSIHQCIGDGLLYRGRTIPHYRDRLSAALTSTSIFFHYVDVGFSGPLA